MKELSLHILDIVQNSIRAMATLITIEVSENSVDDWYTLTIRDNGHGMTEEQAQRALDPFFTTRTTRRVGLGLSLLKAAAEQCDGKLSITSAPGEGCEVMAEFKRSHWDRAPLGDMAETMMTLIASNPEIDFSYVHRLNDREYRLDTREIRQALEELPLNNPAVLIYIKRDVAEGLTELNN